MGAARRNRLVPGLLVLGLAVLAVVGRRLLWGGGQESAPAETAPPAEPLLAQRRPVEEPVASPRVDGLAGVDARWVRTNNEATLLLGDGELERALEMFEQCYRAQPERNVFRHNLVEALVRLARQRYEEHELAKAIELLARAVELAPDREDIDTLERVLARWRSEAELEEDHWTEGSDLFELSYATSREDILHHSQEVLDHLERVYEDLRQWFGHDPVREGLRGPVRVVLYDPEEFDRLTGLGDWAGGVFDGSVRVSVADLVLEDERWRTVLSHELVHVFVRDVGGPEVPGWLNEGLAQLLERADPPLEEARRLLAGAKPFPLEDLRGSLATWEDHDAILRAYAESLLLVARIRAAYGDEALRVMVAGYGDGTDAADSFEAWTQVPLSFVTDQLGR